MSENHRPLISRCAGPSSGTASESPTVDSSAPTSSAIAIAPRVTSRRPMRSAPKPKMTNSTIISSPPTCGAQAMKASEIVACTSICGTAR